MQKSRLTGWKPEEVKKAMMDNIVAEQNLRLVDYAKATIEEIGNKIKSYNSKNNMDRTGNLLNSLCWGVTYRGKLVEGGFYRNETLQSKGIDMGSESFLHEWFSGDEKYLYPVNGHQLAQEYIEKYGNQGGGGGWKVFFAILAPYWGYWEKGFTMVHGFSNNGGTSKIRGASFKQFAVMAEFYDKVRQDLKPARKYYFNVSVNTYDHTDIKKKWDKYVDA